MFEVDQQGVPHDVDGLDARQALELLVGTGMTQRRADRGRMRLIIRLVQLDLETPAEKARWSRLVAGEEMLEPDTDDPGPGFSAHEEIATALGTSTRGADSWITDVLDIHFRLPRLRDRMEALTAEMWKVRQVARLTHWLPAQVAAHVDAVLEDRIDKIGLIGIGKVVALAVATFMPEILEEHDRHGRSGWHVQVRHPLPVDFGGTSFLDASADSVDLDQFAAATRKIAGELREAGDDDPLEVRMAKALGVMARRVLSPLKPDRPVDQPGAEASTSAATTTDEARPGDPARRTSAKPLNILVREAPGSDGVPRLFGEVPRWGVVSKGVLDRWLATHAARFTRVVDLSRDDVVDQHDPPESMRIVVILRDQHCVFPGCARSSEECDLDHIEPYDPHGPPGQTSPDNLACLCRGHHLLKTHAAWRYRRDRHGNYVWTSPRGLVHVVSPEGTHYLTDQVA